MSKNEIEVDIRKELGLTVERSDELERITQSIMDQSVDEHGHGRSSHVLLHIASRKDLNDVEKVACVFIFSCKTANIRANAVRSHLAHKMEDIDIADMPIITDIDSGGFRGSISGMVVAPQGVELSELIAVVMATLMSLVRQMPRREAKDFCKIASTSFAMMALDRDMKL